MSARKGRFIIHRVVFDRTERGTRSLLGLELDGGHAEIISTEEAAIAEAAATAKIIPGATFAVFELVAFAEEPKR